METTTVAVLASIISACAAITSAIISATISLSLSRRTGTQKIAEFRQRWIDDLRQNLAEFAAACTIEMSYLRAKVHPKENKLQYFYNYIILKLNLGEENHKKLVEIMNSYLTTTNYIKINLGRINESDYWKAFDHTSKVFDEFIFVAGKILKDEWKRVKAETVRSKTTTQKPEKTLDA